MASPVPGSVHVVPRTRPSSKLTFPIASAISPKARRVGLSSGSRGPLTRRPPGLRVVGGAEHRGAKMNANGQTPWRLTGHHAGSCNCDWACPCQFNALPTHDYCEALLAWEVDEGNFGDVSLDGVRFGFAVHWPGAIHEGNGVAQLMVDDRASDEQRDAILAITSG